MFGVPIVVILYCFFIAVSPFCPKDSGQTRNFLAPSKFFLKLFSRTRKKLATLACSLVDKEETRRFFLSRGKPIRFRSENFYMCKHKSSHRKGKKYSEDYKDTKKFPYIFYYFLAVFAKIGLFGFRRKTKKLKGVNNQNEKSNYLCPLFQR